MLWMSPDLKWLCLSVIHGNHSYVKLVIIKFIYSVQCFPCRLSVSATDMCWYSGPHVFAVGSTVFGPVMTSACDNDPFCEHAPS